MLENTKKIIFTRLKISKFNSFIKISFYLLLMNFNRKYRPLSYSEGYIDKFNSIEYKLKLLDISNSIESIDLSVNNTESVDLSVNNTESIDLSVNNTESVDLSVNNTESVDLSNNNTEIKIIDVKVNNVKNQLYFYYKRAITYIFHLLLIAFFEIIFFFYVIVKYENYALYNMSDSYINPIIEYCQNLNRTDKIYFFDIFNYLFNSTVINYIGNQDYTSRTIFNDNIIILSWIYVIIIFIIFCLLLFINIFILKIKLNYKKILLDNFFMIIILGLYEYMFFNTIIVKYKNIDNFTLNMYLLNKVNNC